MRMNINLYLTLARIHRPIGIWLLMFPAWWGVALGSAHFPPLLLLFLMTCGAVIMRSAGCVYNDIVDKDLDGRVARTATRPLAAGALSPKDALAFLLLLLIGGALILFSLPLAAILTGFVALGLVFLYPWMKRITYWPQFFLGLTFNMGILMGWLCEQQTLSLTPLLFYGGAIFWTIGYDTIYAFQDRKDDLLIGVKSSAIATSSAPKFFLSLFYGGALVLWAAGGKQAHFGGIYWFFLSLIGFHFLWQTFTLQENNTPNCRKRFESNTIIGVLLFLGIVFSHIID